MDMDMHASREMDMHADTPRCGLASIDMDMHASREMDMHADTPRCGLATPAAVAHAPAPIRTTLPLLTLKPRACRELRLV